MKGKLNEITLIHTMDKIEPARVIVVGRGKQDKFTRDSIRSVAAESCKFLRKLGVKRIATIVHGAGIGGIAPEKAAQALTEGSILGLYTFRKHITKEPEHGQIDELLIAERDGNKVPTLEHGIRLGRILAEATNLARDLINEPANYMTPTDMAEGAGKGAEDSGLELTVFYRDEMEKLG